jgi:mannose-1-phosphate guanylyltransferase
MKARVPAAGKGKRVRPLTFDMPKPMIPLTRQSGLAQEIDP